jgi:hypothetical protein
MFQPPGGSCEKAENVVECSPSMKVCPSCQAKFPDDAMICGPCGARLMLDTSRTMPDPKQSLTGRVIGGNFKVEAFMGAGGMGAVFRARQLSLDREVAVKVLLAPLAMDREMLERFQREARAASNIGHPGIVQVIDMGYLPEGPPYMVMELLQGEDLRTKLSREGALPANLAVPLMLQTCDALQAAHEKGIVHRDMKPDNIFLVYRAGTVPTIKILDFGLSKIKSADRKLTNTGTLLGTPNYMAPEQVRGSGDVDQRADIYAAGIILYEMLTGRIAYDGPSVQSVLVSILTQDPPPPRTVRPDIPPALETVVLKAIAREPANRYGSATQMAVDLARVATSMRIPISQMSLISMSASAGDGAAIQAAAPAPAGAGTVPCIATPPTPPPVSAAALPAAGPPHAGRKSRSGLIALGIVLGVILLGALGTGITVLVLHAMSGKPADESAAGAGAVRRESESGGEESEETPTPSTAKRAVPGQKIADGTRPFLCCGEKTCGLVFQDQAGDESRVYLRTLGAGLAPTSGPLELTPGGATGQWPACFARDDGAFLVLYEEPVEDVSPFAVVRLHRMVASPDGGVKGRASRVISVMEGMSNLSPSFTTTRIESGVVLVWNIYGVSNGGSNPADTQDMGTRAVFLDMDGKEKGPVLELNSTAVVLPSPIACAKDRCLLVWTSLAGGGMGFSEMVSVISTSGKIIEKGRMAFAGNVQRHKRFLVSAGGGAMFLWVDENMLGETVEMVAVIDWEGKVTSEPRAVKPFGTELPWNTFTWHAVASADGKAVAAAHAVPNEASGYDEVLALKLDPGGKVKEKVTIAFPERDIETCDVFHAPGGRPVVIYQVQSGDGLPELYAFLLK